MTNEEKVAAREKEARVAELAKSLLIHKYDAWDPLSAFALAEHFDDVRQARWEAIK